MSYYGLQLCDLVEVELNKVFGDRGGGIGLPSGVRGDSDCCPLKKELDPLDPDLQVGRNVVITRPGVANYLARVWETETQEWTNDRLAVLMPDCMIEFVELFDGGQIPQLINAEEEQDAWKRREAEQAVVAGAEDFLAEINSQLAI